MKSLNVNPCKVSLVCNGVVIADLVLNNDTTVEEIDKFVHYKMIFGYKQLDIFTSEIKNDKDF